jgi:intracellular sulfur oxidation DsrE/DsrF family protein
MLSALGQNIKNHYKKFRPKVYRQLVREGKAAEFFQRKEDQAAELGELLWKQGLAPDQIRELIRDQFFPPSEEDQPKIGEKLVDE